MNFQKEFFINLLAEKLKDQLGWENIVKYADDQPIVVVQDGMSDKYYVVERCVIIRFMRVNEGNMVVTLSIKKKGKVLSHQSLAGRYNFDQESLKKIVDFVLKTVNACL